MVKTRGESVNGSSSLDPALVSAAKVFGMATEAAQKHQVLFRQARRWYNKNRRHNQSKLGWLECLRLRSNHPDQDESQLPLGTALFKSVYVLEELRRVAKKRSNTRTKNRQEVEDVCALLEGLTDFDQSLVLQVQFLDYLTQVRAEFGLPEVTSSAARSSAVSVASPQAQV